jgi:CcmD family protein
MSDVAWMFVAFAAVGIGLGSYLILLSARLRRLERRREELSGGSEREADPSNAASH